jgi:hypothetical protein
MSITNLIYLVYQLSLTVMYYQKNSYDVQETLTFSLLNIIVYGLVVNWVKPDQYVCSELAAFIYFISIGYAYYSFYIDLSDLSYLLYLNWIFVLCLPVIVVFQVVIIAFTKYICIISHVIVLIVIAGIYFVYKN